MIRPLVCIQLLIAVLWLSAHSGAASQSPGKAPGSDTSHGARPGAGGRKKQSKGKRRSLSAAEKARLKKVYREYRARLPEAQWERLTRSARGRKRPPLHRLPAHWRRLLVQRSRWARKQLESLPPSVRRRLRNLSPEERTAEIKKILRPLFRKRLQECRALARKVFSPFELHVLLQLPPKERLRLLEQGRNDLFGLISPWSWARYMQAGTKRKLVEEYLMDPRGLAATLSFRRSKGHASEKQSPPAPSKGRTRGRSGHNGGR